MDLNGYIDSYSSKNSVDKDSDSFSENNKDDDSGDSKDDDIEVSISKEDGVLSYGAHFTIEYHSDPLDSLYSGDPYESGDDDYNNYNSNFMTSQNPGIEAGFLGPIDFVIGATIAIPARIVFFAKSFFKGTRYTKLVTVDKWSRKPKSIQDRLTLEAAKKNIGESLGVMKTGKGKGINHKMEYKETSLMGKKSVVHYQKNPLTNELSDFKFKHHSTGLKYSEELGRYI
ncbi:hypothetical protein [Halarcobacter sp.]|uniref:hypothetical protein n=1 Tax=Halarcobacter sp. TaxID=2321133 RepID=UPI002AAB2AD9|nr:hypothetical protein [Halarcobacter sp.]